MDHATQPNTTSRHYATNAGTLKKPPHLIFIFTLIHWYSKILKHCDLVQHEDISIQVLRQKNQNNTPFTFERKPKQ